LGSASTDRATVDQLTEGRRETPVTRAIRSAHYLWTRSSGLLKSGAALVALVTVISVVALDVPVVSGVVVIVLIPAMLIDVLERRIPDAWIVLASASFGLALSASVALGQTVPIAPIAGGSLTMTLPILFLHLLSPTSMGFGDVKVAIVLGAALGVLHWQLALTALTLAAGIAATIGTLCRSRTIAFGPYLLIGTTIALSANSILLDTTLSGG